MSSSYHQNLEGFKQIQEELNVCRRYGTDYRLEKGKKKQIVDRIHPQKIKLRVSARIQETSSTTTLRMVAVDGYLPPFQAGQYITLLVEVNGVRTSRPYSISSSPRQTAYYDITVRRISGGFVSDYLLDSIQVGDILEATSPAGHFVYNPICHGKDLVFLAGGSGITPFMSMIRETTDAGLDRQIHLVYGIKSVDDVIYANELLERAELYDNFKYSLVVSAPPVDYQGLSGFIDGRIIQEVVGDVHGKTFYICGPKAMYDMCTAELNKLNVPRKRIRQEIFAPKDITSEEGWPEDVLPEREFMVQVEGETIKARAGESLMTAFERHGMAIKNRCRCGECSLCRVRLISGRVFQPSTVLLRNSDIKYGYIHSCQSYPLEDLIIML
jgi:ferredoxin-NADP reductase